MPTEKTGEDKNKNSSDLRYALMIPCIIIVAGCLAIPIANYVGPPFGMMVIAVISVIAACLIVYILVRGPWSS